MWSGCVSTTADGGIEGRGLVMATGPQRVRVHLLRESNSGGFDDDHDPERRVFDPGIG